MCADLAGTEAAAGIVKETRTTNIKSPFFPLGNPHIEIDDTVIQGFWVTHDRPTELHNVDINRFDDIFKMQEWGRS